MRRAVVENVFVNFVGDDVRVGANGEIANEFELLARENFSRGIVRRVQNDRFGARSDSSSLWAMGRNAAT